MSVMNTGITRAQAAILGVTPGIRPGSTIAPDVRTVTATTSAVTANTLYTHPVYVAEAVPLVGLCISVGASVAAVLGKLALYSAGPRGNIGLLIEECAAAVDMNSAADAVLQTNFAASRTLAPAWYWIACKFNGAAQPRTLAQSGIMGNGGAILYGSLSLSVNVRAIGGAGTTTRAEAANTYAAAFPAAPTLTFGTGAPGVPIMGIVAA